MHVKLHKFFDYVSKGNSEGKLILGGNYFLVPKISSIYFLIQECHALPSTIWNWLATDSSLKKCSPRPKAATSAGTCTHGCWTRSSSSSHCSCRSARCLLLFWSCTRPCCVSCWSCCMTFPTSFAISTSLSVTPFQSTVSSCEIWSWVHFHVPWLCRARSKVTDTRNSLQIWLTSLALCTHTAKCCSNSKLTLLCRSIWRCRRALHSSSCQNFVKCSTSR